MGNSRHLAISVFFLVAGAAVGANGCIGTADDAAASGDPVAASDGKVYRTIVQFAPDGSMQPIYETVTVAQQQAEQAARAAFLEGDDAARRPAEPRDRGDRELHRRSAARQALRHREGHARRVHAAKQLIPWDEAAPP